LKGNEFLYLRAYELFQIKIGSFAYIKKCVYLLLWPFHNRSCKWAACPPWDRTLRLFETRRDTSDTKSISDGKHYYAHDALFRLAIYHYHSHYIWCQTCGKSPRGNRPIHLLRNIYLTVWHYIRHMLNISYERIAVRLLTQTYPRLLPNKRNI
jgi:hypothetical protein